MTNIMDSKWIVTPYVNIHNQTTASIFSEAFQVSIVVIHAFCPSPMSYLAAFSYKISPLLSVSRKYAFNKCFVLTFFSKWWFNICLFQIKFLLKFISSAFILIENSFKPTKAIHWFTIKNDVMLNVSNHVVLFLYKSNM